MRGEAGCALTGVAMLVVMYFLFYIMAMIEPGVAIIIAVASLFVGAGTIVAIIVWIVEAVRSRNR